MNSQENISKDPQSIAVLHVALEPGSGVWSVMRDVSQAQIESGLYRAVAMGVVASSQWPSRYAEELERLELPHYRSHTLKVFGTAQFLWQLVQDPPIGAWADDLMQKSGASSVVVHFHNAWLSGVFLPIRSAHPERLKTVVTFHGVCLTLDRQPFRRWLHRQMAQRLVRYHAKLTSVDAGSLPLAGKLFRIAPEHFTIVPNGVKADQSLNAAHWMGAGEFVLGYVGLLAEHKGWQIIAEAVLKVRASGRNVRFVVAGAGPQEAMVRTKANEHPEAIEFIGHISEPRKNIMPQMHALSLMSTYEGLPMVLIEAASVGLPAIVTPVGGITEIVKDGVNGKVIPRSVDSLVESIEKLYDSPETLSQMGKAARAAHSQCFDVVKVVELYHSVYTNFEPNAATGTNKHR